MNKRKAVYPGSFDPVTRGHLDIIERGLDIADHLTVAIANNVKKQGLFTVEERTDMLSNELGENERLTIDAFDGLLADYARRIGAQMIVRGLRAIADFEFEFQMAHMNRRLAPDIEIVFLMTNEEHFYVSSQLAREIASFGGDVSALVPDDVANRLSRRFAR